MAVAIVLRGAGEHLTRSKPADRHSCSSSQARPQSPPGSWSPIFVRRQNNTEQARSERRAQCAKHLSILSSFMPSEVSSPHYFSQAGKFETSEAGERLGRAVSGKHHHSAEHFALPTAS